MRAYVIYVAGHEGSEEYAAEAAESLNKHQGWEPRLFPGLVPETAEAYGQTHGLRLKSPSRAESIQANEPLTFPIKRACSFNHHRLFRKCVELDEPIAVIEHDARCIADWPDLDFEHILTMNLRPMIAAYPQWLRATSGLPAPESGVSPLGAYSVPYRHDPNMPGRLMPGTAAYAVTPEGATRMLASYAVFGWEQSDHIVNTATVTIEKLIPELFEMAPNLRMSHHEG